MHILLNRLHMYPIIKEEKTKEVSIVNNILHSNQHKDIQVNKTPRKLSLQKRKTQENNRRKKERERNNQMGHIHIQ